MSISTDECVTKVKAIVDDTVKVRDPKTIWITFDIDGTLLTDSNIRHQYRDKNDPFKWMYKGIHQGISDMIALYNWCISKGLNVCLITGRVQSLQAITMRNLNNVGLKQCNHAYFKPNNANRGVNKVDTGIYKEICRKELLSEHIGHIILCNIGDQDNDIYGGYAQYHMKILSQ